MIFAVAFSCAALAAASRPAWSLHHDSVEQEGDMVLTALVQASKVKASAASKHNLHSGSGVASSSKRGRSYQKRKHTSSFLADQASTREWSAWKLAAAGHKGRGMSLAEADHSFEPEEVASERTEAGTFRVFRFPLSFSSTALYWRRFGVDVPRECEREGSSCPVLFDFHGSYDSLYTQRNWTKWYQYQAQVSPEKKFILVTPEGSPDAVTYFEAKLNDDASDGAYSVGSSATSWNVLGWGDPSPAVPDDAICAEVPGNWQCFEKTLTEENAYPCYGTHLESLPYLCAPYNDTVLQSPDNRIDPAHQMYARTNCTSSGRANDWDYMKTVVQFVVQQFRADKTRIYFSGQSMGGMATLQFAVAEGKYALPKDLQPAAIAPCSPPGSRMNQLELFGKVPTLLMWGFTDDISPPSAFAGYARDYRKLQEALYVASPIRLAQAMKVAGITNVSDIPSDIPHFLLYVDVLTGGAFLSEVVRRLYESQRVGCLDSKGNVMPLSYSGIMGEGLNTTLSRIVGHNVDWTSLKFEAPSSVPQKAASDVWLMCASVPGTQVPIRVCIFDEGHTYPWSGGQVLNPHIEVDGSGFIPSAQGGKVLHDLIYEDFFQGGTLRRSA